MTELQRTRRVGKKSLNRVRGLSLNTRAVSSAYQLRMQAQSVSVISYEESDACLGLRRYACHTIVTSMGGKCCSTVSDDFIDKHHLSNL
jgi:hypothetical protein